MVYGILRRNENPQPVPYLHQVHELENLQSEPERIPAGAEFLRNAPFSGKLLTVLEVSGDDKVLELFDYYLIGILSLNRI
jgi:hypothetical protein